MRESVCPGYVASSHSLCVSARYVQATGGVAGFQSHSPKGDLAGALEFFNEARREGTLVIV